jgi:DNA-binding NtrC family response regulator
VSHNKLPAGPLSGVGGNGIELVIDYRVLDLTERMGRGALRNFELTTTIFESRSGIMTRTKMRYINPQTPNALNHRLAAMKDLANTLMAELESVNAVPALNLNEGIRMHDEVVRYEIDLIRTALRMTRNHQRRAAQMLGVKTTTLNSKIKKYRIL